MAVIKKGPGKGGKVALTFDDGPDPLYTPLLLECLARFQARATFFVLASKAERHPELIKAMVREGHEVGSHGIRHFPVFLQSYQGTRREISRSVSLISALAGKPLRFYRPPWGRFNSRTLRTSQELGVDIVLWSLDSADWLWGINPEVVVRRLRRASAGDIILCHDGSFVPHRPRVILKALPEVLAWFAVQGLRAVTLSEMLEGR